VPYPIALDESIGSPDDLDRAIGAGAGSIVNLKPGRVGGLVASIAILQRAVDAGWGAFVGGMLETGVGRAVALAVASHDACTVPTDLGPSDRYFAEDLTDPVRLLDGGCVQVPDGPGIGASPSSVRLEAATVRQVTLRR
jgi:O-succinylbenzoate synthase